MKTTRTLIWLLALALLGFVFLALTTPTARAADPVIVRVTTSGTTTWPCGNQSNWSNPCALQTALTRSLSPAELWVAAGTYTPTMGADRTATFQLRDGIALYGGFAMTETLRTQRNYTANVTVLSGDINAQGDASDNAYHVVTGSGVTNTAVLDGFTVTGGNASDSAAPNDRGGGMYNGGGSPTMTNVTFDGNWATNGGGMFNDGTSMTLTNVTFSGNSVVDGGGGMHNAYSSPTLINVTFTDNSASEGGGMYNNGSNPALSDVTFMMNLAGNGGGMYNSGSNPTLTNVTFNGNSAGIRGGGMYNFNSSPPLTNVTFSGNRAAERGGAVHNDGSAPTFINTTFTGHSASFSGSVMSNYAYSSPTIRNTIVWGNVHSSHIFNLNSTATLYDSVMEVGCPPSSTCTNIITADPRLGSFGNWGGSTQTIPLLPGSSAIDTGNDATCPATDQRGVPRPQGTHCDIGAFEAERTRLNLPLIRR